jgi:hypothetical protein
MYKMKKSVVSALAAAVILGGATTPAFAAQNPFSDVNEHHWAYHSVTELAEVGIVTGYDNSDPSLNGKFVGGRNITRYEMAQMIAKTLARIEGETSPFAIQLRGHQWTFVDNSGVRRVVDGTVVPFKLSNGATVDMNRLNQLEALVYELQDELIALGMRVEDLEAHSDKVRWGGKIEYTYNNLKFKDRDDDSKRSSNGYVFRLEPVAYIDDNHWEGGHYVPDDARNWNVEESHGSRWHHGHWSARARLDSTGDISEDSTRNTRLKRAWAQGEWDKLTVKLGRFGFCPPEAGLSLDTVISGGEVTFGSKWLASIAVGRINGLADENEASYLMTSVNDGKIPSAILPEYGNAKTTLVALNVQYPDRGVNGLFGGLGYYHAKNDDFQNVYYSDDADTNKADVIALNLGYRFSDFGTITGGYARNAKADNEKDAWKVLLRYGSYADASAKGQWAVWLGYSKFGNNVAIASDQTDDIRTGSKGWHIGAAWAPFKNIGLIARYANGKYILDGEKYRKFFGRVEFFF